MQGITKRRPISNLQNIEIEGPGVGIILEGVEIRGNRIKLVKNQTALEAYNAKIDVDELEIK